VKMFGLCAQLSVGLGLVFTGLIGSVIPRWICLGSGFGQVIL